MEPNLAAHIENNEAEWFAYVNNDEFINMGLDNAVRAEESKAKEREGQRRTTLASISAGNKDEQAVGGDSSDSMADSDDGKYSAQMSFKKPSGMVKKTRTQIGASNNVSTGHASNFHAHSAANQSP